MQSKTFWGIFWTKFSLITAATSAYFTYTNHENLNRFIDNVMYNDIRVAQNYFEDSNGLIIDKTINNNGLEEVYLLHRPSGEKYSICTDMMPPTSSMLESIANRSSDFSKDDCKKYLDMINSIEKKLYEKL